ncbi:hypothetical protein LTR74_003656 [Friedmanniomyces endolithicus]|nr:hypothetical protein LTR74_003656 [Friedmanniomyces endolithicus]
MQETAEELVAEAERQSDIVFTTDAVLISKIFAQAKLNCPLCRLLAYGISICLDQLEGLSTRGPLLLHRKYIPRTTRFGFETLSQSLTPAFGFEVFTERAQPICRLVESAGAAGQYVDLSHCWGDPATVPKTMRETLLQHCMEIPDEVLSTTFRHAIQITRGLDIRYIWIDALCIVQNDPEDWAREAAKMRTVYSDAFLTIAAASASDGTGGCFHSREGGEEYQYPGQPGVETNTYVRLPVDHSFFDALSAGVQAHRSVERFSLATRKWIFQERMLSRRVLYFTRYELAWECRTETACECDGADCLATPHNSGYTLAKPKSSFPNTALTVLGVQNMSAKAAYIERWAILAEEYSSRNLSYPADALIALSGVARAFDTAGLGHYFAGMWEFALPLQLAWRTVYDPELETHGALTNYTAPSWSWVSSRTRVTYPRFKGPDDLARRLQYCCAEILTISSKPATADPFGHVLEYESILEFSAPALQTTVIGLDHGITLLDWPHQVFDCDSNASPTHLVGEEVWIACLGRRRPEEENWQQNTSGCSVVLHEVGGGLYKRVGLLLPWADQERHFSKAVEEAPRVTFRVI